MCQKIQGPGLRFCPVGGRVLEDLKVSDMIVAALNNSVAAIQTRGNDELNQGSGGRGINLRYSGG